MTWPKARHALRAIERFVQPVPVAPDGLNTSGFPSADLSQSQLPASLGVDGRQCEELPQGQLQTGTVDNSVSDITNSMDMQLFSSTDMEALGPAHEWDSLSRDVFGPSYSAAGDDQLVWP